MKRRNKLFTIFSSTAATTIIVAAGLQPHLLAAPSAMLSLTPATVTITQGSSKALTIQVKAGSQKISGVQACITYDPTQVSLVNTDTSASPLAYTTPSSSVDCDPGEIQVSRFGVTYPTGVFTLATLQFKALQAGVDAVINFDTLKSYIKDNSTKDASGSYVNILSNAVSATIKLTAVTPAEASPNPTSPSGNASSTAALTDANHTGQAASSDVTAKNNISKKATPGSAVKSSPRRTLYIVLGGIATLIAATYILKQYVGLPGKPMSGKVGKEEK
jgi:hypothetical protein